MPSDSTPNKQGLVPNKHNKKCLKCSQWKVWFVSQTQATLSFQEHMQKCKHWSSSDWNQSQQHDKMIKPPKSKRAPTPVSVRPVSVRPVSVRPVSVRPVSVRPVSVRPVSVRPVSVRPVSVRPVSVRPVSVPRTNTKDHGQSVRSTEVRWITVDQSLELLTPKSNGSNVGSPCYILKL